jgi:hypothetical protein
VHAAEQLNSAPTSKFLLSQFGLLDIRSLYFATWWIGLQLVLAFSVGVWHSKVTGVL